MTVPIELPHHAPGRPTAVLPDGGPELRDGAVFDAIVVGARAAGASTAMLLARRGLRVAMVERGVLGSDPLSTHALIRGGVLQLLRWGLLPAIVAAGTPPVTRTTFRYGSEQLAMSIKPTFGVDALYAPRRTVLDPILVRAAADAGAEVHERTAVTDLVWSGDRVVGVRVLSTDQQPATLRAPLVIGADGVRSLVAEKCGAVFTRLGGRGTAVTYGYWSDVPAEGYEWVFRPDACSGLIPTNGGQVCVFAGATPARIGRGGLEVLREVVGAGSPELARRLADGTPPPATRTWIGAPGYMRQASGPGWALVGDAGYYKDPIGAHGLTDALRDAELLAGAVVDGFASDRIDDAVAEFEATRDRLSVDLFDVVDRIASQRWDDAEIADLLVRLSSTMAAEVEELAGLDVLAGAVAG